MNVAGYRDTKTGYRLGHDDPLLGLVLAGGLRCQVLAEYQQLVFVQLSILAGVTSLEAFLRHAHGFFAADHAIIVFILESQPVLLPGTAGCSRCSTATRVFLTSVDELLIARFSFLPGNVNLFLGTENDPIEISHPVGSTELDFIHIENR